MPPKRRVLDLLRRFGRNTTSFQVLEPGLEYWFDGDDACVAYADTGGAWVVAGGPICSPEAEHEVMARFAAAARAARRRLRFFGIEGDVFGDDFRALHIGEQPTWNPQTWAQLLGRKRSLREQLRRARAKGVTVRQVAAHEVADTEPRHRTRVQIDAMIAHWQAARAMAPMRFVVYLDPYHLPEERRFFVAERDGEVVGILIAVPIYARDGWLFEDVLRDPCAPNGTVELMFDHAMRDVASEGARHVTFGLAPLAGSKHRWMQWICDRTRWLYDFEGLRAFKAKLMPHAWEPVYLAYPSGERGALAVIDTLKAFAGGSFLQFGWATLLHRAPVVVTVLALLLLPWTLALALAPSAEWFPCRAIQLAWIGTDAALFAALVKLARRWSRNLAVAVAAAALADFSLGVLQLAAFNASRASGALDWLIIAAALGAPLFAAAFVFSARGRASASAVPTRRQHP